MDPYALIDSAGEESDPAIQRVALEAAIKHLSDKTDRSAEDEHALGYAWYMLPDEVAESLKHAQRHFTEALRLKPEHRYARLYLAHCFFDTGRFEDALRLLDAFEPDEFAVCDQAWRDAKNAELILVCSLELSLEDRIGPALEALLARASVVETDYLASPTELARALTGLLRNRADGTLPTRRAV